MTSTTPRSLRPSHSRCTARANLDNASQIWNHTAGTPRPWEGEQGAVLSATTVRADLEPDLNPYAADPEQVDIEVQTAAAPGTIGSGIAALRAAIELADDGQILMLTKGGAEQGSTAYAQGGIAAAIGDADSPELHAAD